MENNKEMLTDEQLNDVTGGGGASPTVQAFDVGEVVYIRLGEAGKGKALYTAIVEDCRFEERLNTWTYRVRFGKYSAGVFTPDENGGSSFYYRQASVYRH